MRANFVFEKFSEETDAIHDMGIGELHTHKDFPTVGKALQYMYNIAPTLAHVDSALDILHTEDSLHFIKSWAYKILNEYFRQYVRVDGQQYSLWADAFEQTIVRNLKKKRVKLPPKYNDKIYERFEEHSDPIEDMGLSMKRKFEEFLESRGIAHSYKPLETALGYAANQGEYAIVEFILDNGIHPDINKGFAMKQAIEAGDMKMIEILWEYGADMKVYGHKFLEWTAMRGNWSNSKNNFVMFEYFLQKGAFPGATFFGSMTDSLDTQFYKLIKKYTKMNFLGESINEKLSFTEDGDPIRDMGIGLQVAIKDFCENEAPDEAEDKRNWLWICAREGKYEFVKYMINNGWDINYDSGMSLVCAAFSEDFQMIKYLLDNGAKIFTGKGTMWDFVRENHRKSYEYIRQLRGKKTIRESFRENSDPIEDMGISLKHHFRQGLNRLQLSDGVGVVNYKHQHGLKYLEIDFYGRPPERIIEFIKKYLGEEYFKQVGVRTHALHTIATCIFEPEYAEIFQEVMNIDESVNEKFSEEGDPVKDMGIGHDAQMKKLNAKIGFDWSPKDFKNYTEDKIIDIESYAPGEFKTPAGSMNENPLYIKVSKVTKFIPNTKYGTPEEKEFYLATSNLGEPYSDDPTGAPTAKKAMDKEKRFLVQYFDNM